MEEGCYACFYFIFIYFFVVAIHLTFQGGIGGCYFFFFSFSSSLLSPPSPKSGSHTQPTRKGLGNNLVRKCLAVMPWLQNSANFLFRSSTRLVRYYYDFQNFYACSTVNLYPVISLVKCWLTALKTLPGKVFPQTLPCGLGLGSTPSLFIFLSRVRCVIGEGSC